MLYTVILPLAFSETSLIPVAENSPVSDFSKVKSSPEIIPLEKSETEFSLEIKTSTAVTLISLDG